MKLVTLSDNSVSLNRDLLGEHGFSIYLEINNFKLLFDTGQTFTAAHNAEVLKIDLKGVPVALSHGHYDHTGGLKNVLQKTGPTRVYGHPSLFSNKYSRRDDLRYIGIPHSRSELEEMGAQFHLSRKPMEIFPHVILSGEIPRNSEFEGANQNLLVQTERGKLEVDPLLDDQALILNLKEGLFVILGCAHSGMINSLEHAKRTTGKERIIGVVGGTHLGFGGEDRLSKTIQSLKEYDLEILGASHCTGLKAASILAKEFGDRFIFNNVGTVIEL
ncbi:MAG: MBL fold metallo-hydrolase [Alphaproteobacteria bacterium]|nr:MBL fold metallo-hydrolase [Alphaproteobacteria bacterium]